MFPCSPGPGTLFHFLVLSKSCAPLLVIAR
uniref:Uncharacterized protein n=1 Tax=Anguilla anguilla TaxID=7936 RepID=A0A0E9VU65_ANGAN